MKVPFVDLRRQYTSVASEIRQAFAQVLEGGQFILGPNVCALEEELAAYCQVPHAVGVASGTDALRLALEAVGIAPGEEVITSPFTFIATAEMISKLGAVPVFADIDLDTYTLDSKDVARKITGRTKAILPVHLYGHPADMEPLMELADRHKLWVIEDAAQAIGADYGRRRVGGIGHVGCFSFFPTKNLGGCGDGGLVTTGDPVLADRVRMLRQHGSREKYVHHSLGWSSRLDELQAAALRVKLRYLDEWTERRRAIAVRYRQLLTGTPVVLPVERPDNRAVYHLFTIASGSRDELKKYLADRGVQTAVHYPLPLHLQPVYRDLAAGPLPRSERAAREVLSLPLFPEMTVDEVEAVATAVTEFFAEHDV